MKKVIAVLVLFSTMVFAQQKGTFTDPRDNKTYKTVKIVSQTWMAENLNYAASGSKCYDNKPENCKKYGRLYDWNVATRVCPYGWHLPSDAEWDVLMAAVDGTETAGGKLKAKSGWKDNYQGKSGNGTDQYGFSALPGGGDYCFERSRGNFANFANAGLNGLWWSASKCDSHCAYWCMDFNYEYVSRNRDIFNCSLFSVRCVRD